MYLRVCPDLKCNFFRADGTCALKDLKAKIFYWLLVCAVVSVYTSAKNTRCGAQTPLPLEWINRGEENKSPRNL